MSWRGILSSVFVIESLLAAVPERTQAGFYGTAAGTEIDLVLELGGKHGLLAIEIKRSLTAKLERGFIIHWKTCRLKRRLSCIPAMAVTRSVTALSD